MSSGVRPPMMSPAFYCATIYVALFSDDPPTSRNDHRSFLKVGVTRDLSKRVKMLAWSGPTGYARAIVAFPGSYHDEQEIHETLRAMPGASPSDGLNELYRRTPEVMEWVSSRPESARVSISARTRARAREDIAAMQALTGIPAEAWASESERDRATIVNAAVRSALAEGTTP